MESTNHVIPLLRVLPPQLKVLKARLDTFSYLILGLSSNEFNDLNLIHPPRVALMPFGTKTTLSQIAHEISAYNSKFPNSGTAIIGIYSGSLPVKASDLERMGVTAIYQSPLEDEQLINKIFEIAPISPDHKDVPFDQLIRINIVEIENSKFLPFDVFLYLSMNEKTILYLAKDSALDEKTITKFRKNAKYNLYIRRHDLKLYQDHAKKLINEFGAEGNLTEIEKSQKVASRLAGLMGGFFNEDDYSEDDGQNLLNNLKAFVSDLKSPSGIKVDAVAKTFASGRLTTVSHNENVAAYCALFGLTLGLTDSESLKLGGMLHDIGKGTISSADDKDYRLHPIAGLSSLIKRQLNISKEVQDMVLYHHEHTDGSGFPSGLKGPEISPYAKVCAFANEFDKLTSIRPGFPQLSPAEAFRKIAGLDGEPPLPIYDPAFHKPLIDKFLDKNEPPLTAQPEPIQTENIPNLVECGRPKTGPGSETIDYGKIKRRNIRDRKSTTGGEPVVSIERLLKTEQFYRPKFLPLFKFDDPAMQEEITEIAQQLVAHFRKDQ